MFDHFWCESLWMVVRNVDVTLVNGLNYYRVDSLRRNGPGALRAQSMFLGEGLCHLASSRVLNTDKQYGTLSQPWASRRTCRQVRQLNLQPLVLSSKRRDS